MDLNSSTSRLQMDSFYTAEDELEMSEETLNAFTSSFDTTQTESIINENRRENLLLILTIPAENEELRLKSESELAASIKALNSNSLGNQTPNTEQACSDCLVTPVVATSQSTHSLEYGRAEKTQKTDELLITNDAQRLAYAAMRNENSPEDNNAGSSANQKCKNNSDSVSGTKDKSSKPNQCDLELPVNAPMEQVVNVMLRKLKITNAIWTKDLNGKTLQVMFPVEYEQTYERLLDILYDWGIGDRMESSISVLNCMASKYYEEPAAFGEEQSKSKSKNQSAWQRFMDSVRCRLSVINVVTAIRKDATLSFDFCVLVISAAIQAGLGLIDNSFVYLISSMLISPLMGPILAAVFGTTIKDGKLCRKGIRNELVGLALAILIGFLFGVCVCVIANCFGSGASVSEEMLARSELRTLALGVVTAITSGIAVTVAILDGNVGSLIGVAISASILPPAVNSGIFWSYACFSAYDVTLFGSVVKTSHFSKNPAVELFILGGLSMCLTLINIFCIFGMGITMLKVKEIAPVVARQDRMFWQRDVKIARNLQKSGYDMDTALLDEFYNLPQADQDALGINTATFCKFKSNEPLCDQKWTPIGNLDDVEDPFDDNFDTVYNLKRLFATVNCSQTLRRRPLSRSTKQHSLSSNRCYRNVTEIFGHGKYPNVATQQISLGINEHDNESEEQPTTSSKSGSGEATAVPASRFSSTSVNLTKQQNRFTVTPVVLLKNSISKSSDESCV